MINMVNFRVLRQLSTLLYIINYFYRTFYKVLAGCYVIIIIKNEKIRVTLCEYAAGGTLHSR